MRDNRYGHGTWRLSDDQPVPFSQARRAWARTAREVLIETAQRYHAYVTYGALAEEVQVRTGIRTRSQMRNWIGSVLGQVAEECERAGEPPLTALCVRQDETVGDGYRYVIDLQMLSVPEDLDQHAAEARLECYRYFGASDLPPGGGEPALTPRVAAARRRRQLEPVAAKICPSCNTALPASGSCDYCD